MKCSFLLRAPVLIYSSCNVRRTGQYSCAHNSTRFCTDFCFDVVSIWWPLSPILHNLWPLWLLCLTAICCFPFAVLLAVIQAHFLKGNERQWRSPTEQLGFGGNILRTGSRSLTACESYASCPLIHPRRPVQWSQDSLAHCLPWWAQKWKLPRFLEHFQLHVIYFLFFTKFCYFKLFETLYITDLLTEFVYGERLE